MLWCCVESVAASLSRVVFKMEGKSSFEPSDHPKQNIWSVDEGDTKHQPILHNTSAVVSVVGVSTTTGQQQQRQQHDRCLPPGVDPAKKKNRVVDHVGVGVLPPPMLLLSTTTKSNTQISSSSVHRKTTAACSKDYSNDEPSIVASIDISDDDIEDEHSGLEISVVDVHTSILNITDDEDDDDDDYDENNCDGGHCDDDCFIDVDADDKERVVRNSALLLIPEMTKDTVELSDDNVGETVSLTLATTTTIEDNTVVCRLEKEPGPPTNEITDATTLIDRLDRFLDRICGSSSSGFRHRHDWDVAFCSSSGNHASPVGDNDDYYDYYDDTSLLYPMALCSPGNEDEAGVAAALGDGGHSQYADTVAATATTTSGTSIGVCSGNGGGAWRRGLCLWGLARAQQKQGQSSVVFTEPPPKKPRSHATQRQKHWRVQQLLADRGRCQQQQHTYHQSFLPLRRVRSMGHVPFSGTYHVAAARRKNCWSSSILKQRREDNWRTTMIIVLWDIEDAASPCSNYSWLLLPGQHAQPSYLLPPLQRTQRRTICTNDDGDDHDGYNSDPGLVYDADNVDEDEDKENQEGNAAGDSQFPQIEKVYVEETADTCIMGASSGDQQNEQCWSSTTTTKIYNIVQSTLSSTWCLIWMDPETNQPVQVQVWMERGALLQGNSAMVEPRLVWRRNTQHQQQHQNGMEGTRTRFALPPTGAIRLLHISRLTENHTSSTCISTRNTVGKNSLCRNATSFVVETINGERVTFSASTRSQRDAILHQWKWTVARLATLAVLEDALTILDEYFAAPSPRIDFINSNELA